MLTIEDVGQPANYGLPGKFTHFRKAQTSALVHVLNEEMGFVQRPTWRGVQMPVGSGKTGYFMALDSVRRSGNPLHRTAIITMTKPLQEQIMRDFSELGVLDVRGRSNYECVFYNNCETGADSQCSLMNSVDRCEYQAAYQTALGGRIVLTNLSYWIAIHKYGKGLGKFDLLIIDEAHDLLSGLTDAASSVWPPDQGPQGLCRDQSGDWIEWAKREFVDQERRVDRARNKKRAKDRLRKLQQLASLSEDDCVADTNRKGWTTINQIWPADSADQTLYLGTAEVCLLSGTLTEKAMSMVGAVTKTDPLFGEELLAKFERYPLEFSSSTWQLHLTDAGRIQYNMSRDTKTSWRNAHTKLVSYYVAHGIPGIIHTVSYARAEEIAGFLPAGVQRHIIRHRPGGDNIQEAVDRYKAELLKGNPAILISPAVTTGYDFPEAPVNYVIVSKMPRQDFTDIPNLRDARRLRDKSYVDYEMMMTFGQEIGRGKRSADQRSFVHVLDSHARYLVREHMGVLLPGWVDNLIVWGKKDRPSPVLPRI